jgi:hypothetical protein
LQLVRCRLSSASDLHPFSSQFVQLKPDECQQIVLTFRFCSSSGLIERVGQLLVDSSHDSVVLPSQFV